MGTLRAWSLLRAWLSAGTAHSRVWDIYFGRLQPRAPAWSRGLLLMPEFGTIAGLSEAVLTATPEIQLWPIVSHDIKACIMGYHLML